MDNNVGIALVVILGIGYLIYLLLAKPNKPSDDDDWDDEFVDLD